MGKKGFLNLGNWPGLYSRGKGVGPAKVRAINPTKNVVIVRKLVSVSRCCIKVQGARLQNVVQKVVKRHIGESMLPCAMQCELWKMSQERKWKLFLSAT